MDIVSSNQPQDNSDNPAYDRVVRMLNGLAPDVCSNCGERPHIAKRSLCRKCYLEWKRAYNKRNYNREKQRDRNLRTHFGITQEEYDVMFFKQGGCCAICGRPETKIHPVTGKVWPLVVDHNHETGQVRELLCNGCNIMLWRIERDRRYAEKFLKYLKKHDR